MHASSVCRVVIEIASDDGEIERDALNIKPPQSQAGPVRREKLHKHKHKGDRRREKQKQRLDKDKDRERKLFENWLCRGLIHLCFVELCI